MQVNVTPTQFVEILTAFAIAERLRAKAATLPPTQRAQTDRLAREIRNEADRVGR
jgi:hypothetical protein